MLVGYPVLAVLLGQGTAAWLAAAAAGLSALEELVLVLRAQLLAAAATAEHPVLVLCYNRALADRIEALIAPDEALRPRLQVRTFHGWCAELARRHRIAVPAAPEGQDDSDAPARLAQAVERVNDALRRQAQEVSDGRLRKGLAWAAAIGLVCWLVVIFLAIELGGGWC